MIDARAIPFDAILVREAFERMIASETYVEDEGEGILIDTPYPVGRGYMLRVYLHPSTQGIAVSDGGFATAQIEMSIHSRDALKSRYRDLQQIAERMNIRWDGAFSYEEASVDAALRRLKRLALAVQEAQELITNRGGISERSIVAEIAAGARMQGAKVERSVRINIPHQDRGVLVDLQIERSLRRAAVEIMSAKTPKGVEGKVNRMIADFQVLASAKYDGLLVAVYDEDSPAADASIRARFRLGSPKDSLWLPESKALGEIMDRLAA